MMLNLKEVYKNADVFYIEDLGKFFRKSLAFDLTTKLFPRSKLLDVVSKYGDNVLLGAWSSYHRNIVNILYRAGIRPSVMWTSTLGQMEMTPNMVEYRFLYEALESVKSGKIKHLLLNERLYESLNFLSSAVYFPHTLDLSGLNPYRKDRKVTPPPFKVDIFTPLRQGKNILSQIAAIRLLDDYKNVELHINFSHPYISPVIENFGIKAINHGWLETADYYNLLAGMHFSLQVTHTESFNYAVAERMALGIPVLVSYNIYNVCKNKELAGHLCVKGVDSPYEISKKIKKLMDNPPLIGELGELSANVIREKMAANNKLAVHLLAELFE